MAYAYDLRAFIQFLDGHGVSWDGVEVDHLARFVRWLEQPAGNVVLLHAAEPARSRATVARAVNAVHAFFDYHATRGLPVALVEELLGEAIRPEFAAAVYLADPDDAVLGRPLCQVPACGAILWGGARLCRLHLHEWRDAGEPSLEEFCSTGASDLQVRPDKCRIAACPRSRQARRLCSWHLWRWRKAGKPDQDVWVLGEHAGITGNRLCRVADCGFPATAGRRRCCDWHATRFTNSPFDDPDVFALTENAPSRRVGYDMRALSGVARLEVQFLLQQRHDERGASLTKKNFDRLVHGLAEVGGSLREGTEADWGARLGDAVSLLRFARDRLDLLADGAAMNWDDDSWDLRRALGARWDVYKGRRLKFGPIPQPWLQELAKPWARLRLSSRHSRSWSATSGTCRSSGSSWAPGASRRAATVSAASTSSSSWER